MRAEAEDVIQDAYVRAYQNLHQFEGRAPFAAWLLRIAVNEALGRLRTRQRNQPFTDADENGEISMNIVEAASDLEQSATRAELGHLLEEAVLRLPEAYRTVVMLRDVEELSTAETAEALNLTEDNVKGSALPRPRDDARYAVRTRGGGCEVGVSVYGRAVRPDSAGRV